jgi:hypothetical protein
MDLNAFWALLDRSASQTADQDARLEWLTSALASMPAAQVAGFAVRLDEVRRRVDTWQHWQAADLICGGLCSDDGFFYFQAWLVGLGRETFEAVAADPDALADVPHVRHLAARGGVHAWADDEWPDWEGLDYVAAEALAAAPHPIEAFSAAPRSEGALPGQPVGAGVDSEEAPVGETDSAGGGFARLERLLGDRELLVSPEPAGEQWDFADPREIERRMPRLGVLFGKVA